MMLPSTLAAAGYDFTTTGELQGSSVVYYAPSPQSDLLGRPSLTVSHETTKAGIVRTLVSLKEPVYNATLQKYDGFLKTDLVMNRAATAPTSAQTSIVEAFADLLANVAVTVPLVQAAI
jgi:hypothetical protein